MPRAAAKPKPSRLVKRASAKPATSPRSSTEVALYQRSEPARRDQAEFMAAWDKLPWMRAVVEKIAYAKASVRWTASAVKGGQSGKLFTKTAIGNIRNPRLRRKAMKDAGVVTFDDHPIVTLFADPNPELTSLEISMLKTAFEYVGGESFIVMEAHPPGPIPNVLWPMPPHWCKETPTEQRPEFFFDNGQGFRAHVPMERVLWQRGMSLRNPYGRAKGLFQTMEDELGAYENASELVNYQFYNRNRPDIVVSLEGASDDQLVAMEDRFTGKFQGISQSFRSLITNAKLKVEKIPADFVHSQLVQLLAFMRDATMQVPGVPKELMAVTETSNRATITAAMSIFMEGVVVPLLEKEREFYQKRLVPIFDDRIILDYDNPVPEDKDFALQALNGGKVVVQVNETRALVGLRQLTKAEGGELWIVPQGASLKEKLEPGAAPDTFGLPEPGKAPPPKPEAEPASDGGSQPGGQSLEPGAEDEDGPNRPTRAGESPAEKKSKLLRLLYPA